MRIARRAGYRRMAWKNGLGVTEEVAAFPDGSDVDGFDWRLSIAHVGADGPFSVFPGIDRTIALLDGPGLALDLHLETEGGRTVELRPDGAPFSFSGDWKISGRNLGGPTVDLNVMTRRGRCCHEMQRLTLEPGRTLNVPGFGWAVFNTPARIETGGLELAIERFDALSLETGDSFTNSSRNPAEVLFAMIQFAG